jgi:maleylpyruvate isomerase
MADTSLVPEDDLRRVTESEARFQTAVGGLSDAEVRRASRLPGWTVAHVLTHVARNADSHRSRADAAGRGEVVDQYPGGYAGRAAAIDAGAVRTATELLGDVRTSAEAMQAAWRAVPASAWANPTRDVGGRMRALDALPSRRWQELEVHLVDLDVGVGHRDWPDDFVGVWLPEMRHSLSDRLPAGTRAPERGVVDERDELAWLYGRLHRAGLPKLAPWG